VLNDKIMVALDPKFYPQVMLVVLRLPLGLHFINDVSPSLWKSSNTFHSNYLSHQGSIL